MKQFITIILSLFLIGFVHAADYSTHYNKNINIGKLSSRLKGGQLEGCGEKIVEICKQNNISPSFFCAVMALESGWGKSKLAKHNNFGGIKIKGKYHHFKTRDEGLNYMAGMFRRVYHAKNIKSVEAIGKKYAGSKKWPSRVKALMRELQ